jgi:hypothetical protein
MPAAVFNRFLEEVQIAQEAAWGDAAAPTVGLAGITEASIKPMGEAFLVQDKRATSMPGHVAGLNRIWGEVDMSGIVSYTQIQYFLNAMFALDAGTPFAYIAALTPAAPVTNNILIGQPSLVYAMSGAVMDRLVLHYTSNGPITFDAHWIGKMPVALARVALTPPTPIIALGAHTVLSIDPIATAHGTTPLALTGFSADVEITNTRHPVHHMGTLNPDNYAHGKWGGSVKLTVEATVATKAYLTAMLAVVADPLGHNVRFNSTGSGTSNLTLDFSGYLLEIPQLFTDDDGVTTFELNYTAAYSAQGAMLSCWKASNVAS